MCQQSLFLYRTNNRFLTTDITCQQPTPNVFSNSVSLSSFCQRMWRDLSHFILVLVSILLQCYSDIFSLVFFHLHVIPHSTAFPYLVCFSSLIYLLFRSGLSSCKALSCVSSPDL